MNETKELQSSNEESEYALSTVEARARLCLQWCVKTGLDPIFRPFDIIQFQGRWVVYANRGATDALAAKYKIQREVKVRPHVVTLGNVELLECVARATDTATGRYEERTATVLLRDHANAIMKCETKAIRRATLALLGFGITDESELDTMKGALALADAARNQALAAHLEWMLDRIRPELPALKGKPLAERQEAWNGYVAEFAERAGITKQESQTTLAAAMKVTKACHERP